MSSRKSDPAAGALDALADLLADRVADRLATRMPAAPVVTPEVNFIDETAASKRLGISVRTLQSWRSRGAGPPHAKFGARVRYSTEALAQWAEHGAASQSN